MKTQEVTLVIHHNNTNAACLKHITYEPFYSLKYAILKNVAVTIIPLCLIHLNELKIYYSSTIEVLHGQ